MTGSQKLDELIKKIDTALWVAQTKEEKLNLLQEFENIMAEIEGRPSYKVKVISEEESRQHPDTNGYFNGEAIYIHPRFLKKNLGIRGVSRFSFPNALQLIAHEGRHAWQQYVIENPDLDIVDRNDRLAMQMNYEFYVSNVAAYGAQLIELDARRFAREVLTYISDGLEKNLGFEDLEFKDAIQYSINQDYAWASALKRDVSVEEIVEFEEVIREKMEATAPGIDFSNISIFEDAVHYLKTDNLDMYIYAPSIRVRNGNWFEKELVEQEETGFFEKIDQTIFRFT